MSPQRKAIGMLIGMAIWLEQDGMPAMCSPDVPSPARRGAIGRGGGSGGLPAIVRLAHAS